MMQKPPPRPRGMPYKTYSDILWLEVRRRFLAGETGPDLCAEFGLARSTFSARAKRDGWRRKDQPDEPLPADPGQAAEALMNRAVLAAAAGRIKEAEDFVRTARRFRDEEERSARTFAADAACPHCGKALSDPVDGEEEERTRLHFKMRILRIRRELFEENRARAAADPDHVFERGPTQDGWLFGDDGWRARDPLERDWPDAAAALAHEQSARPDED